jgi:enoyl-CoA hydratase/carnithine racemase
MKDLVTVEPRNGYAIVRLDRPEKKNAMNRQLGANCWPPFTRGVPAARRSC